MAQIKRWRPCPMAGRHYACKQRFWCHDRPRSEKNGRFGYARGVSMRKPRAYFSDPVVHCCSSRASLNLRPPLPRGWELGDPVRTKDRTSRLQDARAILSGGPSTCYTPNLERTDAHGAAAGSVNCPNELHLLMCIRWIREEHNKLGHLLFRYIISACLQNRIGQLSDGEGHLEGERVDHESYHQREQSVGTLPRGVELGLPLKLHGGTSRQTHCSAMRTAAELPLR
eukprot:scaffold98942_cov57-Phaeocystis_antarctica.AAC.2